MNIVIMRERIAEETRCSNSMPILANVGFNPHIIDCFKAGKVRIRYGTSLNLKMILKRILDQTLESVVRGLPPSPPLSVGRYRLLQRQDVGTYGIHSGLKPVLKLHPTSDV